ncbi:MAG TPA: tol-pal system protein YbgF [Stellaceae bacterium]|nr:tol-pal system protein YbgF [Stellaceae bacterium]
MRYLLLSAALLGALHLSAGAARAQDRDLRPLLDRIDRLERDMNQLQRQVYRGVSPSGAPVPVTPADSGTAVNTELRMDQLENQMRSITGSLEEVTYNIDQLKQRLDKLVSDVDLRLSQLEHPGDAAAKPSGEAVAAAAPRAAEKPSSPPGAGNPAVAPSKSGVLTAPGEAQTAPSQQTAAANPATGGPLPTGTPQEQYNYAFGLLRQADYPAAEQALRSFVQRYPNDPLAGNAQYWLGETYYVRKDYTNAAQSFAEGYKRYPKSGKAADNLLKLGMSLGNLGQKKEACLTFGQLGKDFPNASANIKERASQEKQHLGC